MQIGIVGLPYSGKTSFFQTLTETQLDVNALQKKEANQAVIKIQDDRLDLLTSMFNPKKKVNATIEIVDIAGVQKGDHTSSAFTSNFINKVKTNDALIHVVRGFQDEAVPHLEGSINMQRDIKTLEEEFLLTDMAFVENQLDRLEKDIKKQKVKDTAIKDKELILKWNEALQNEIPLRDVDLSDEDLKLIRNYQPLTAKPMLIALNLDESDINNSQAIVDEIANSIKGKNIRVEPFFAKIEMELMTLAPEERKEFMADYGLTESPLSKMIRVSYSMLGLQSFFTVGEDECRAWTIRKGMNAQESAGVIHTDFFNKFIRAEVVSYKDFIHYGSFPKCKEAGVFRLEGKEYVLVDGDIMHIRHG